MFYEFIHDEAGKSYLGGEPPAGFAMPETGRVPLYQHNAPFKPVDMPVSLQYLGFLDHADPAFAHVGFGLHLICPVFATFEYFFVDYSNPLAPKIDHISGLEKDSPYKEVGPDTEIVYRRTPFSVSTVAGAESRWCLGTAGEPEWIQDWATPRSPATGKEMAFVCQLRTFRDIPAQRHNLVFDVEADFRELKRMCASLHDQDDGLSEAERDAITRETVLDSQKRLTHMNFWCDGNLYVFAEPETKLVCYLIQNT